MGAAAKLAVKTSADYLANPRTGKVFVGYFSEIKRKIQTTLVDRFARRTPGTGHVTLLFTLNSEGWIEKVTVMSRETEADEALQGLAIQCLRESAPFRKFPPELDSPRLVFSITVYFGGK